jgi:hypothetical protein
MSPSSAPTSITPVTADEAEKLGHSFDDDPMNIG